MLAVIICGGIGARMGELTASTPKSLIPFHGKPILTHILERIALAFSGSCEVVLVTGFCGEQISSAFGSSFKGLTLRYIHDARQLGTRNRLLLARHLTNTPFLFLDGDVICEPQLLRTLSKNHNASSLATLGLAVDGGPAPTHGFVTLNEDRLVQELIYPPIEKPHVPQFREIHANVFTPQFLDFLAQANVTEISRGLMLAVRSGEDVRGVVYEGQWAHIVKPDDLESQPLPASESESLKLESEMTLARQTDAGILSSAAYKGDAMLAKRKSLYRYTVPHYETSSEVLALLKVAPGMNILDVGCGNGDVINRAAEREPEATFIGVDISNDIFYEAQRTAALQRLPSYFMKGDIQQLNFDDDTFDRVLALHMLYHVPDVKLGLKEIRRVLCSRGELVCSLNSIGSKPFLREMKAIAAEVLHCEQYPDLALRTNVENCKELLAGIFAEVETHLFESTITLDDAQPYVDYIDSTREFWHPRPQEEQWKLVLQTVRREVIKLISSNGRFLERNVFGILVARGNV